MSEDFEALLAQAAEEHEPEPGVDWPMALAVGILRALERRDPGFKEEVRACLVTSAEEMEQGDDFDRAAAPEMRELIDSWVFTE